MGYKVVETMNNNMFTIIIYSFHEVQTIVRSCSCRWDTCYYYSTIYTLLYFDHCHYLLLQTVFMHSILNCDLTEKLLVEKCHIFPTNK